MISGKDGRIPCHIDSRSLHIIEIAIPDRDVITVSPDSMLALPIGAVSCDCETVDSDIIASIVERETQAGGGALGVGKHCDPVSGGSVLIPWPYHAFRIGP